MRTALTVAAIGATAVVAAAQVTSPDDLAALLARLDDQGVAFNATIEEVPEPATVEAGRLVAMGGAEGGGSACFSCHQADGSGDPAAAFPRLAALPAAYLAAQLDLYASGERDNPVMTPIAERLSPEERRSVAVYYSVLPATFPDGPGEADAEVLQRGGTLAALGSAEQAVPACSNCHGPYGTGIAPSVPPLAGQIGAYTAARLTEWREGDYDLSEPNPMPEIAKKLSEADIEAVAEYYRRLRPPAAPSAGKGGQPDE